MPDLQITDGNGRLDDNARDHVFAHMLFPDDEDRRTEYETLEKTIILLDRHENDESEIRGFTRADLENLMIGPRPSEFLESTVSACFWGEMVGELVTIVLHLKTRIGAEASLNKAIKVLRHRLKLRDRSDRNLDSRSDSAIKSHWKRLKPVAHLWAAYIVTGLPRWTKEIEGTHPPHFLSDEDFSAFLRVAETIAKAGEHHFSKRQGARRVPLIDSTLALKIPKDLGLSVPGDYLLSFVPVTDEEVQVALTPQK